jgi:SPP1 gp7 family putative phage head morphogenesis protein
VSDLFSTARDFQRDLLKGRERERMRLLEAYHSAWETLTERLNELANRVADAVAGGQDPRISWNDEIQRLTRFKADLAETITTLALEAADQTQARQLEVVKKAGTYVRESLRAAKLVTPLGNRASTFSLTTGRFADDQLQAFVGLTGDGSPLESSFRRLAGDLKLQADRDVQSAIEEGLALGEPPRRIVTRIRAKVDGNERNRLADPAIARRIELAAHSSVMMSAREASLEGYRSMGVKMWRWVAAGTSRTCPACWALDGKVFEIQEPQRAHPNCRCVPIPILEDDPKNIPAVISLDNRFTKLTEEQQTVILGPAALQAYRDGEITDFDQFVGYRDNGKGYGPQVGPRALTDILGDEKARFYLRGGKQTFRTPREVFESNILELDQEVVAAIDESGALVGRKRGNEFSIHIAKEEESIFRQRSVVHNHPETGGSFSLDDFSFAIKHEVKEMVVVAIEDGEPVRYTMSVEPGEDTWNWIAEDYGGHLITLLKVAQGRSMHQIWTDFKKHLDMKKGGPKFYYERKPF